jgi:molybdopterin-guanine dinucleotide biosynthesis protein A
VAGVRWKTIALEEGAMKTACILTVLVLAVVSLHVHAADLPVSEKQKIEALLHQVEQLSDAVFIRNNREYNAKTAAMYLRSKWEATLEDITTAEDFIAKVASVSSTSGQPYRIRFKDGHEVLSGEYLSTELQKLEQP